MSDEQVSAVKQMFREGFTVRQIRYQLAVLDPSFITEQRDQEILRVGAMSGSSLQLATYDQRAT